MSAADAPSRPALPSEAPQGEASWIDLRQRLPRRGQSVRILTAKGADHEARFDVAFTDDWPAGVSWSLANGHAALPFTEVVAWSPDPAAAPPARPTAPRATAGPDGAGAAYRPPGMLAEVEREIARTGRVLRMVPPPYLDWTPHPAVPTLRTLAHRLVRMVARMGWILELDTVELAFEPDLPALASVETIIDTFAANESVVCNLTRTVGTEELQAPWTLERNAVVVVEMSRGEALRRFGLTPLVQHRGEMSLMLSAVGVTPPHAYPEWAFADGPADGPTWTPEA